MHSNTILDTKHLTRKIRGFMQCSCRVSPILDLLMRSGNTSSHCVTNHQPQTMDNMPVISNLLCARQVVARGMVEQGKGGAIVNMSTAVSKLVPMAGFAAYSPSKAAIDSLTQAMALELGPHKVTVRTKLLLFIMRR